MTEYEKQQKKAKKIQNDIFTARDIIKKGLLAYKRKKLKVRSNKLAEDMKERFKDLELYDRVEDIQDSYGCEYITEKARDRLMELWEMREKYVKDNGKFEDRVTEILDYAMAHCGDRYEEFLTQANMEYWDNKKREREVQEARDEADRKFYRESVEESERLRRERLANERGEQ